MQADSATFGTDAGGFVEYGPARVTILTDLIDELFVDMGVPAHDAARVVITAYEYGLASRVTSRVTPALRSVGAERQARYRENIKNRNALAKANDVANAPEEDRNALRNGVTDETLTSSFLSSSVEKQERGNRVSKKENTKNTENTRGTRLSADWQPDEADRKYAADHGCDPDKLRDEFVDYWTGIPGQRGVKLNWPGTWRNNVRRVTKNTGQHGKPYGKPAEPSLSDLARKFAKDIRENGPGDGSGSGRDPVRLLSQG